MVITRKVLAVVQYFKNVQNECKKNKMLVWSNYILTTESVEVIIEMPILINYLLNIIKG